MPTVYEVLPDTSYQALEVVDLPAFSKERKKSWKFDGTPVNKSWKPLELYVREPLRKKPDIWGILGNLVFEPEAASIVQMCLDQSCEKLPLPFEDRELVLANVTYVINCLDKKLSDYDPERPHVIGKYVFHVKRLDFSLFKIPETRHSQILTVEGLASPEDEFKPLIEKHKLKGLKFYKLFSWD